MSSETVLIRQMNQSDLDSVTRIHMNKFPGSRSTKLGKPFVKKMYQWFVKHHPYLSLVAEVEGNIVGFMVGSIGGYGRNIFRYSIFQIIWGLISHPGIIFQKDTYTLWSSFIKGLIPYSQKNPKKENTNTDSPAINAALSSMAVSDGFQGKGIGRALVLTVEAHALELGANSSTHSIEKKNLAAQHLLKSCGWTVDYENNQSYHFIKKY